MSVKSILILSTAAFLVTACATKPEPVEEIIPVASVPQQTIPTPAPQPQSAPPVVQAPTIQAPAFIPPPAGSFEDFLYQTGGDSRVYFGYNESTLSEEARNTLRRQAGWLSSYSNVTAVVEGNADERGTREYNLALAARRANSVKAFLVSQGISPSRLTTVSYGKERPIEGGSDEWSWSRNRNGNTNLKVSGFAG